jgi:hypothetical protein
LFVFEKDTYLNKKSANFTDPGQGLPLKNLSGADVNKQDIDKWKEFKPDEDDY